MDARSAFERVMREALSPKDPSLIAWENLYTDLFLDPLTRTIPREGVVQIVRSTFAVGEDIVSSYRADDMKKLPKPIPGDTRVNVDWKATVLLNIVCEMRFRICLAVVQDRYAQGQRDFVGPEVSASCTLDLPVHANPYQTNMLEKGSPFKCSFPTMYFQDHNYEDPRSKIKVGLNQGLCVELVADLPDCSPVVLFRGSVTYKILTERLNSMGAKPEITCFIPLVGPAGKGRGQLGVRCDEALKSGPFFRRKDTNTNLTCCLPFISRDLTDIVQTLTLALQNPSHVTPTQWVIATKPNVEQMEHDDEMTA